MDAAKATERLLELVEKRYPNWEGYRDPRFVEHEITYKQDAARKVQELLAEDTLRELARNEKYDEIIDRIRKAGSATNLLFLGAPSKGDMSVLYHRPLDRPSFCDAVLDLLYAEGSPDERLGHYLDYVQNHDLPSKWTFPTYLLFLCHPADSVLVKPVQAQWLLELASAKDNWSATPSAATYRTILALANGIQELTASHDPSDMIDVQSLIWVTHLVASGKGPRKVNEFLELLEECHAEYMQQPDGEKNLALYPRGRAEARESYDRVKAKAAAGEDYTDDVLLHFLPHMNSAGNRERGAWIHIAPAITKDIKSWFEGAGWRKREDWPQVAREIFAFVQRCVEDPSSLEQACADFVDSPFTKGLQTGMITPFLNALQPQQFALINNKSRRVTNYFLETNYRQTLKDYKATNLAWKQLLASVPEEILQRVPEGGHNGDILDQFSHWLVTVKKHPFGKVRNWKIEAVEQTGDWEEWQNLGIVTMGFNAFGDLSEMTKEDFEQEQERLLSENPEWLKKHTRHLLRFSHRISEGDRVVVNAGTDRVLGVGTVTGPYMFKASASHGHQIAVDWDDATAREVSEPGWKKIIMPLSAGEFDRAASGKPEKPVPPDGPDEPNPTYTLTDCARDTGIPEAVLERWVSAIDRKGQAIIYGPPGTGKTYVAQHLATALIAGGRGFKELVQFHPSYAYEDFIQGIRPESRDDGSVHYPTTPGRFLDFCERTVKSGDTCVLIVDEINRANLSKVFGELMYLLEYRNENVPLAGGGLFKIPDKVRIIGTMNTADRSIALVDHALRRRFAFLPLFPDYDLLRGYHESTEIDVEPLIQVLEELNRKIDDRNYEIGVSFFMNESLDEEMESIWTMEIEPYLEEVFFDRRDTMDQFRWEKIKSRIGL